MSISITSREGGKWFDDGDDGGGGGGKNLKIFVV